MTVRIFIVIIAMICISNVNCRRRKQNVNETRTRSDRSLDDFIEEQVQKAKQNDYNNGSTNSMNVMNSTTAPTIINKYTSNSTTTSLNSTIRNATYQSNYTSIETTSNSTIDTSTASYLLSSTNDLSSPKNSSIVSSSTVSPLTTTQSMYIDKHEMQRKNYTQLKKKLQKEIIIKSILAELYNDLNEKLDIDLFWDSF